VLLASGQRMPIVGLGTYGIDSAELVKWAHCAPRLLPCAAGCSPPLCAVRRHLMYGMARLLARLLDC
jgi:hypothetical protein